MAELTDMLGLRQIWLQMAEYIFEMHILTLDILDCLENWEKVCFHFMPLFEIYMIPIIEIHLKLIGLWGMCPWFWNYNP